MRRLSQTLGDSEKRVEIRDLYNYVRMSIWMTSETEIKHLYALEMFY